MEVVVLGGWLYEHAPGEVNCHQETISDVRLPFGWLVCNMCDAKSIGIVC